MSDRSAAPDAEEDSEAELSEQAEFVIGALVAAADREGEVGRVGVARREEAVLHSVALVEQGEVDDLHRAVGDAEVEIIFVDPREEVAGRADMIVAAEDAEHRRDL